jgi:hypothetical protein
MGISPRRYTEIGVKLNIEHPLGSMVGPSPVERKTDVDTTECVKVSPSEQSEANHGRIEGSDQTVPSL